jgi:hypothetical protein
VVLLGLWSVPTMLAGVLMIGFLRLGPVLALVSHRRSGAGARRWT